MARVKLNTDVLEFEKHKNELEAVYREKDRVKRSKERTYSNMVEVEKFSLMADVILKPEAIIICIIHWSFLARLHP